MAADSPSDSVRPAGQPQANDLRGDSGDSTPPSGAVRPIVALLVVVSVLAALILAWGTVAAWLPNTKPITAHTLTAAPETATPKRYGWAEEERIRSGGEHYKPLKMVTDTPGVDRPRLEDAEDVALPANTSVIGIENNGEAIAVVQNTMLEPSQHILNLLVGPSPVSVTYCNLADCVRVLTREGKAPIPLRVGGLDVDHHMVFLLEGTRYGQQSPGIPLRDHPYEITTWNDWKLRFPDTKVYIGELPAHRPADQVRERRS